jgi:hypothetical protein
MVVLTTGTLWAAEAVQEIPTDWVAPGMRRVPVASVRASSALEAEVDQYAPARAVDGNRGSKWVASIAPSQTSPQWIILELFGTQEVSAVAVFGERIDNDGIQDAQIQIAGRKPDKFVTVATIRGAKSPQWLATFDPVKATAVRLLITRSGGPSPHTDVYEIEVYGRKLSAADLKGHAEERLSGCASRWKEIGAAVEKLRLKADPQFAGLRGAVDAIQQHKQKISERLARWDTLGEANRYALAAEIERLEVRQQRLMQGLGRAAAVWPDRARDLAAARQAATQAAAGEKAVFTRDGGKARLSNNRVSVVLDEASGAWDATWR